jgi:hypothetical protein
LPPDAARTLFPGAADGAPILGLTLLTAESRPVAHAGGVALRFVTDAD